MTPAQSHTLKTLKAHLAVNPEWPTMLELSRLLDLASPASAFRHVTALVAQGYITRITRRGHHPQYELTPLASTVGASRASSLTDEEICAEVGRRWGRTAAIEALVAARQPRQPAAQKSPVRTKLVGAVRAACHRLGLGDDDRKAIQHTVTGKASMSDMSIADLGVLLSHLNRDWAGPRNPHVGKIKALWWSLYWLCMIDDPGNKPLDAFVRRQTGLSALRFLDVRSSASVIEALKSMGARAGVKWPNEQGLAELRRNSNADLNMALLERHGVVEALGDALMREGVITVPVIDWLVEETGADRGHWHWDANLLDASIKLLGRKLRLAQGKARHEHGD